VRDVTFAVSGITGTPTDVAVSFTAAHTSVGDLRVFLAAPGGAITRTIFSQTGAPVPAGCGDNSDLAGPYTFSDSAPASPTWWSAAATAPGDAAIPSGSYRASTSGGGAGGANAPITTAFAGVSNANGTWFLRFRDGGEDDAGSVSAATLHINGPDSDFDGVLDASDQCPGVAGPSSNGGCPVDATAPETTIDSGPPKKTKKKKAKLAFSSNEPGSSFGCSVDKGPFSPCTSAITVKVKRGKHTFDVRATDAAGNTDPTPARHAWKVKKKRKKRR
jgi:hypothetical protein